MKRTVLSAMVFLGALGIAAVAYSESQENLIRRYPFDPACPWGRIANGKGMIVRCLGDQEAAALAKVPDPNAPVPASASSGAAPASSAAPVASAAAPSSTGSGDFNVTVGPLVADKGKLDVAKLAQPKDRYKRCVLDNGGLKGDSGEVQVRFMVMTKGIAEGVTVHKRMNVSTEAARCVADIVDRRRVGTPEEPMVGATVFIKFGKGSE
jgi:hypothetical protein